MAYFDGVKIGDRVWDFIYGWGTIIGINYNSDFPIIVNFDNGEDGSFSFEGTFDGYSKQTLFWDEVKFEIPKKPKVKLKEWKYLIDLINENEVIELDDKIELIDYNYSIINGFNRDDKETAKKALKQIKRFTKLLALRDQECPNSRGYEFQYKKENWYIYKQNCGSNMERYECYYSEYDCLPCCVYFKTERDAQKICNILNKGKFDLEGE